MGEYRTAWEILLERRNRGHLLIGDDDEYGRPRPVKADHDRIRALEAENARLQERTQDAMDVTAGYGLPYEDFPPG